MAINYTSTISLNLVARNMLRGGLTAAGSALRSFNADQTAAVRAESLRQLAVAEDGARQRTAAIRAASVHDTAVLAEAGRGQITNARLAAVQQARAIQDAARGQDAAVRQAARVQLRAVQDGLTLQTAAIATATRRQVDTVRVGAGQAAEAVRVGAGQAAEAVRLGATAQIASIKSIAREESAAVDRRAAARQRLASVVSMGVSIGAPLALGAAVLGVNAVKQAADFQRTMIQTAALTGQTAKDVGASADQMGKGFTGMSTQVIDAVGKTGQSAHQLADSLYYITSSGFTKAADAEKLMTLSGKDATIGHIDAKVAADALTTALNAYGMSANQAGQYNDVLLQSVNLGKAEFGDMARSLGAVLPLAAQAHISFKDIGAAMSTLTLAGLSPRRASMDLNRLIQSILNPTKGQRSVALALGLKFDPAQLAQSGGLEKFMEQVKAKTAGPAQAQLMKGLFGNQAGVLGGEVLTNSIKNYKSNTDIMNKTVGDGTATQKAFLESTKSLSYAFTNLKNLAGAAAIQLGGILSPAAYKLAGILGSVLTGATARAMGLIHALQNPSRQARDLLHALGVVAGAAAGTFGVIARTAGQFAGAVGRLIGPLGTTTGHLRVGDKTLRTVGISLGVVTTSVGLFVAGVKLASLWQGITTLATKAWAAAQRLLNFALKDNPIGLVVTVLAGLALVLTYAYEHSKTFRDMVNGAWALLRDRFGPILATVASTLHDTLAKAVDYVHTHVGDWLARLRDAWTFLSNTFGPVLKTVAGILATVWVLQVKAAIAVVKSLWNWGQVLAGYWSGTLSPALSAVAGVVSGVLHTALSGAADIAHTLWQKAHDLWDLLAHTLKPIIQPLADLFTNTLGKALSSIADTVKSLVTGLGGLLAMLGKKVSTYGVDHIKSSLVGAKAYADSLGAATAPPAPTAPTGPSPSVVAGRLRLLAARDGGGGMGGMGGGGARAPGSPRFFGPPVPRGFGVFGPPVPRGYGAFGPPAPALTKGQSDALGIMKGQGGGKPDRSAYDRAVAHYRVVEALYKGHQASMVQVTAAINGLQKAEHTDKGVKGMSNIDVLRAQLSSTEHRRNDAIRHAAAAAQQRDHARNDRIRHAAAAKAHHDRLMAQRAAHHRVMQDLGKQQTDLGRDFRTDLATHAYGAARTVITQLVALQGTIDRASGFSRARTTADQASLRGSLTSQLGGAQQRSAASSNASLLKLLGGQLTVLKGQETHDRRIGNRPAALADIARIVSLDRRYEVARTGDKGLADSMAKTLGQRLMDALGPGSKTLALHAPRASGLARGAYGLYPRTTPGQAAEFGTTTVAFGGTRDQGMAALVRMLEQQLSEARQQTAYYRQKYQQDEALLHVGEQTRDGVRALVSGVGRGPVTPVTDPLRLTGSPRPARAG